MTDKMELIRQAVTDVQWKYLSLYLKGYTYTNIAYLYDVTVKNVEKTVKRAIKRAQKRLGWFKSGTYLSSIQKDDSKTNISVQRQLGLRDIKGRPE